MAGEAPDEAPQDRPEPAPGRAAAPAPPEAPEEVAPEPEPAVDLADLGQRYAVAAGLTDALRNGFRELKRRPSEAKRLAALLRGLARKHEPEARRAAHEITQLIERIQTPPQTET
jgi:hypothetical protein